MALVSWNKKKNKNKDKERSRYKILKIIQMQDNGKDNNKGNKQEEVPAF